MSNDEFERRRSISFEEAEGRVNLPTQFDKKQITPQMRAYFWAILYEEIENNRNKINGEINSRWRNIIKSIYLFHFYGMIDEFRFNQTLESIKGVLQKGDYVQFYAIIQYMLRMQSISQDLKLKFARILEKTRSTYRVVEETLVPFGSEGEIIALEAAVKNTKSAGLNGARAHMIAAIHELSEGNWANSARESMHSVESAVRQIKGTDSLAGALDKLLSSNHIHPQMNRGFKALYNYTSDENGIRHPILDDGDAKVTEADAMFMLGACASFVSYLVTSARKAELIQE